MKDKNTKTGLGKSKKKNAIRMARRASKRLAGLPLDPIPELKTTNRVCRALVKQSNDIVARVDRSSYHTGKEADHASASDSFRNMKILSMESSKGKRPTKHMLDPSELGTENKRNKEHGLPTMSPSRNLNDTEVCTQKIETDNDADEKPDLPFVELWQDPCIAFAIKTLTGVSSENSESIQVSSGSNNSELGGLSAMEDNCRKEDLWKKHYQHLSNVTTPDEHDCGAEIRDKERLGSPHNMAFANGWSDPCIEFAIKILKGEIPLDSNIVIQNSLQQRASSSQSQESSGWSNRNFLSGV